MYSGGCKITIKRRNIFSVLVAGLFISILFSPISVAEEPVNRSQTLSIWLPDVTEDDYFTQIQVTPEDLQTFLYDLYIIIDVINTTRAPDSQEGTTITLDEWQQIGISINDFIDSIIALDENFPNVDTQQLVSNMINAFFDPLAGILRPAPMFSAGYGFTWIPFYGYESFVGVMLRPMFTRHIIGFTRTGGIIRNHFQIGSFSMWTLRFIGLFVNFGDIGTEKILGPTMYIGTVFYSRM